MQSENNQDLPGQAHNSPCKHWAEVPDAHNCFCNHVGAKGSHRSNDQETYRNGHQKSQHRHKEELHQIRDEFVKQLLTFRGKIHHKDHRDHRAGIVHSDKWDPEKVGINR